jgi:hypothetical protein
VRDVFARFVILVLALAVSISVLHLAAPGPLSLQHVATESAIRATKPAGAAATVLHDVASARTGFLPVN